MKKYVLWVKGMFLKLNIFLGKEILLEGAGDSFLFNVNHSSFIDFIVKIYLFFAALQSSQADCLPFISAALIYFPRKVPTHIWQLKFTPFDLLAISLFQIYYHYYHYPSSGVNRQLENLNLQ